MIIRASLLAFRKTGDNIELMFSRTKGQNYFILPGGKLEQGETIEEAFARELQEELSVDSKISDKIGEVEGHTPDGRPLKLYLLTAALFGEPVAGAEIEEIRWFNRQSFQDNKVLFTPIFKKIVLPFLDKKGLW